ncbi:hypothetical protein phytr_2470 [Candidatus Phycorickettsia trachydisci]|uniref:Uncharacterized protein n=1 Tax=Candidatus Phycorickettsia trachydisci TaxID=2115978 RepID=A0A2P1P7G0_9RICK|nr:ankyrin repeat domain-containing protein [Candidatus Phycorickettsia trachydisci]AVP87204.1 hypothetical protein phytr_2470 [Candidatus Phycorickettsia trachydisci]
MKAIQFGSTLLHQAVMRNDLEMLKCLVQEGVDINTKGLNEYTPLHFAVEWGYIEVVKFLLDNGANVNATNILRRTALHLVIASNNPYAKVYRNGIVELLLAKGGEIQSKDTWGLTPLHLASLQEPSKLFFIPSVSEYSPVDFLLKKEDIDVNITDNHNAVPLHGAVLKGNFRVAELLMARGAKIDVKGPNNLTPLGIALNKGDINMVILLLSEGADIKATTINGNTPSNVFDVLHFVLTKYGDINTKGSGDITPLEVAAQKGQLHVVKFLIEQGAELKDGGSVVLYEALKGGNIDVIKFLVELKARISREEIIQALCKAAEGGKLDVIKFLIDQGAYICKDEVRSFAYQTYDGVKLNIVSLISDSKNPLHRAAQEGQLEVIEFLLSQGVDVNTKGFFGNTALHSAINHPRVGSFLLEKGVEIEAKNHSGRTALDEAIGFKKSASILLLLGARAKINLNNPEFKLKDDFILLTRLKENISSLLAVESCSPEEKAVGLLNMMDNLMKSISKENAGSIKSLVFVLKEDQNFQNLSSDSSYPCSELNISLSLLNNELDKISDNAVQENQGSLSVLTEVASEEGKISASSKRFKASESESGSSASKSIQNNEETRPSKLHKPSNGLFSTSFNDVDELTDEARSDIILDFIKESCSIATSGESSTYDSDHI